MALLACLPACVCLGLDVTALGPSGVCVKVCEGVSRCLCEGVCGFEIK